MVLKLLIFCLLFLSGCSSASFEKRLNNLESNSTIIQIEGETEGKYNSPIFLRSAYMISQIENKNIFKFIEIPKGLVDLDSLIKQSIFKDIILDLYESGVEGFVIDFGSEIDYNEEIVIINLREKMSNKILIFAKYYSGLNLEPFDGVYFEGSKDMSFWALMATYYKTKDIFNKKNFYKIIEDSKEARKIVKELSNYYILVEQNDN